ncbi:hypothetical protein LEP1GSC088_0455 [Leptospira interrogans str. L1207]|nr:hypothetical protein LEP1GSC088_0455 [Leptospira interrogans str. L1207]
MKMQTGICLHGGGEYGPCSTMIPVGLTGGEGAFTNLDLHNPIPESDLKNYDRIGIIAHSLLYYLSPDQTPDNSHRYTSLFLNNMIHNGIRVGNVRRGDVGFSKGCPESWLTSPTYIYISMFNMSEMAFSPNCSMQEALIDSTTGFFMTNFDDYITKPD